ncbi:MAG: Uma2 family endonuclease [Chloroherpetonaceae bacterium]|nr:Uma2 family endonuclease [Chloroherpetonaceae bacterium]MDW8438376.1 Uma2 family endonuclease [Chloroherpetonaceae bacterium]
MEQVAEIKTHAAEEEYFALERANRDAKHEYFGGKIVAMAGAELVHNAICANVIGELRNEIVRKKKKCLVLTSDQRVKGRRSGGEVGYFYPDVVVACGEPELAGSAPRTLLNPSIVVEVLSKTNSGQELMEKLKFYREIESLSDALFVDSESISVLHFERASEKEWRVRFFDSLDEKIIIASQEIELAMSEIYRGAETAKNADRVKQS